MNRNNIAALLLLAFILGLTVFLTACNNECFFGSRETASNFYRLDIERMTGTDRITLNLNEGDTLEIQFETIKGFIYMEIIEPDGTLLYAGNGKDATDFTLNISESDAYSVHVEAHNAKGMIHIQQKDQAHKSDMSCAIPIIQEEAN